MIVRLADPWLVAEFGGARRTLGWALNRPGFHDATRVVWREVRDADLGPDLDARQWLAAELDRAGLADAPCLVTSAPLARHALAEAVVEGVRATALATVGLSNAERIGTRRNRAPHVGTINLAVLLDTPLADGALVEALSLTVEARTAAVLDAGLALPGGLATGTGTDCALVAAPPGPEPHAGKHTAAGEALGRAVLLAMRDGIAAWRAATGGILA